MNARRELGSAVQARREKSYAFAPGVSAQCHIRQLLLAHASLHSARTLGSLIHGTAPTS
jgi:hypothetical protein